MKINVVFTQKHRKSDANKAIMNQRLVANHNAAKEITRNLYKEV